MRLNPWVSDKPDIVLNNPSMIIWACWGGSKLICDVLNGKLREEKHIEKTEINFFHYVCSELHQ